MKKIVSLMLVLALAFSLAGATVAFADGEPAAEDAFWEDMEFPEEVVLTYASTAAPANGNNLALERANEHLKEWSGGKLSLDIVYNGALGNEQSTFAQCMEGSIDMTGAGIGTFSTFTPCLDVLQLPFLVGSYEQEWAVMQSDEFKALRDRATEEVDGVTLLTSSDFGIRQFATIAKPVKTIDDLKGLKIRSIGNPVIDEALQLVGANPVNITYTDLYSALQNKVIDGEEINVTSVSMQKHYEVINYISEIGLYPFFGFDVISDATVERLPEGYFDLLKYALEEAQEWYMTEEIFNYDAASRQDCIDNGVEFNTIEDKDAWLERMQPLYEKTAAADPMYAAFIDKALSLQE